MSIKDVYDIAGELLEEKVCNAKLIAKLELIKAVIEENYAEAHELLTLLKEFKEVEEG